MTGVRRAQWGKRTANLTALTIYRTIMEGYRKPFSVSLLTGVSIPQ